ncbi:MAG: thiolase family protein [bacterium]
MPRRIAIVGSAQSKFKSKLADQHYGELIYKAVMKALEDTGIGIEDIDTVVSASCDMLDGRSISNVFVAEAMGAFLKEETKVEEDGSFAAVYTFMRLLSGAFDTAMIVAYSKGSESHPHFYTGLQTDPHFLRPLDLDDLTVGALQANVYMNRYGVTGEQCAKVAVKNRKNGSKNPYAVLRKEVSLDEVMKSPVLASPIRELEAYPVTDGVCVVIMAAEEKAKKMTGAPAWITGAGHIMDGFYPGHRDLAELKGLRKAAGDAYRAAGIKNPLGQIDVAEVSESFAYQELMICEALGLCGPGEGGKLIDGGKTEMGGALPVNPSGGALCANPFMATGLVRIAEAALQVSGMAGERQVPGAKTALAHGSSGLGLMANAVVILSKD